MATEPTPTVALAPCPFCGAGVTHLHINRGTWRGISGYGEPVSVEVRHWCADAPGQPSRLITRVGRDEASAIAAWNRRAQPAPAASQVPLTDEQLYNEKQTAIPQLFDLARQWADNQIHSYQFSHEAEKIVDAVARRVEAAHGIKET